jgi:hypothetical protein
MTKFSLHRKFASLRGESDGIFDAIILHKARFQKGIAKLKAKLWEIQKNLFHLLGREIN